MPDGLLEMSGGFLPRVEKLAQKSLDAQWSAETEIAWEHEIALPFWLPKRFYTSAISQFFYGEQVTAEICRRSLEAWKDHEAVASCIETQIADEERHSVVYSRYLERLGDIAPVDPVLKEGMDAALSWSGPPEACLIAVQILLEGEALRSLDILASKFCCPLFEDINRRISQDEARHVAFGRLFLTERLKTFEQEERIVVYRWIKKLWEEVAGGTLTQINIPGFIHRRVRRRWMDNGWQNHSRALMDIGLVTADELQRI